MSSTASPARIAANKANALKSTGPRTPEGKARVSENALKHGLRSERNPLDLATDTCLPAEREEFLATIEAFSAEFAPQSPFETRLVERLAQIDLRLNRAVRIETSHLEMHMGLMAKSMGNALPPDDQTRHNWLTTLAFLKNPSATTLLAQYESRLARDFARTLAQLRQSQALRTKCNAQNLVEQTQSVAPPSERTTADAPTLPTQSHASHGIAATAPTEPPAAAPQPETAEQTQPLPHLVAKSALTQHQDQTLIPGGGSEQTSAIAHPGI